MVAGELLMLGVRPLLRLLRRRRQAALELAESPAAPDALHVPVPELAQAGRQSRLPLLRALLHHAPPLPYLTDLLDEHVLHRGCVGVVDVPDVLLEFGKVRVAL